jgi:hypothetical protein
MFILRKSRNGTNGFIRTMIVVAAIFYMFGFLANLPLVVIPNLPTIEIPDSTSSDVNYTIWKLGNLTYAQNEKTKTIVSNLNPGTLLQKIINSLSAEGGGVIHLEAGTYTNVDPLDASLVYLKPNIVLWGSGQKSTILNNIDFRIGVPNVTIRDMGFTGPYHGTYLIEIYASATNITLERLHAQSIRGAWGVFVINPYDGVTIDGVKFIDLSVRDCDGYAISINGVSVDGGTARNIEWIRCKVYEAGLLPTRKCDWIVGFDFPELARVENLYIKDCLAEYCWESGFHSEYAPTKVKVVVENCVSNYNGQKPFPEGGWMWGYGFLVSKGITLINPQGIGNYGGLISNHGNEAKIIYRIFPRRERLSVY